MLGGFDDELIVKCRVGNPVIAHKHIEGVADIADFRDPKFATQWSLLLQ